MNAVLFNVNSLPSVKTGTRARIVNGTTFLPNRHYQPNRPITTILQSAMPSIEKKSSIVDVIAAANQTILTL